MPALFPGTLFRTRQDITQLVLRGSFSIMDQKFRLFAVLDKTIVRGYSVGRLSTLIWQKEL
jgi:hypothetical protein